VLYLIQRRPLGRLNELRRGAYREQLKGETTESGDRGVLSEPILKPRDTERLTQRRVRDLTVVLDAPQPIGAPLSGARAPDLID
jgi:hypothetical protein